MKKRLMPLLFALFTLFSGSSHADEWFYAKVIFAGKQADGTLLRLDHWADGREVAFTNMLFKVDDAIANEALAIGMAGIASHKLLSIRTDLTVVDPNTLAPIKAIYLSNRSDIN